jgi:hypothetical protein
MADIDEMLKALAAYRGPVTHCPTGSAGGAGDLHAWAQRRSVGRAGVPDADRQQKQTDREGRAVRRLYLLKQKSSTPCPISNTTYAALIATYDDSYAEERDDDML